MIDVVIDSMVRRLEGLVDELKILKRMMDRPVIPNEPTPTEPDPEPVGSYIDVGEGSGKAGDTVSIDVVGGTHIPVTGFSIAIGCGHKIKVASVAMGGFFRDYLGDTKFFTYTFFPNGWPEPFVVGYLGFWKFPPEYREIPPIIIPPETVLMKITYSIPAGHIPMDQRLFNATSHFKKTDQHAEMLRIRNIFTHPELPHGVRPALMHGSVKIV